MIHYSCCPVCGGEDIQFKLAVKDHTVSQKEFPVWQCNACTARFTQDVPGENEIGGYYASENYVSHSDTRTGIVNRLYHVIRRLTLRSKRRIVIKETGMAKGTVLDIGCGTGAFIHHMHNAGWETTGLEPDEAARKKADELYALNPLEPSRLFELQPAYYNAITMWHVLEHVHNLHGYLQQVSELLAPGGRLLIAVPNYTSYDAGFYKEHWAAWDVPRHLYHFSPACMNQMLKKFNLQLLICKPMWYDSFYVSMLSEQYKHGKGNLIRASWVGLVSNLKAMWNIGKCSSVIYIIGRK